MAVYVDDMRAEYGRMIMCHMIASTEDELHTMADKIGVARKWHQKPPKHTSHYDIALSKKALAIEYGAIEITWKQAMQMTKQRDITGIMGTPQEAEVWYRQYRESKKNKPV